MTSSDPLYAPAFVKALFNRMAASYDRVSLITSFGFSERWRRAFLGCISQGKDVKILDLMTGRGELLPLLAEQVEPQQIWALDFSAGMLDGVHRLNAQQFGGQLSVVEGDALAMPFPDQHFDGIVCGFGLKTFDTAQIDQLVKEVFRVLKPGGFIRFIEISVPPNRLLRALYGFHLGRVVPLSGKILLGNPTTYRMLWRYTQLFKNATQAAAVFRNGGFAVTYRSYFYGCATGFEATKIAV